MNKSITIEKMTMDDIYAVCQIDAQAFAYEPWPREWFEEGVSDPYGYYFTAYYNGELAGYVGMYHNTPKDFHYCKITTLAVKEEFRKKGIGKALMLKILDKAKELNIDRIKLEVDTRNFAVNFYEDLGFKIEEFQKNYYEKAGGDAYIMWRYENE